MTPTPPPGSFAKVQRMDTFLGGIGQRIGEFVSHPHMLNVAAHHPTPGLALALILLALCGVALSVPVGVWMFKRRHHLRSSFRGLVSLPAWRDRRKWNKHVGGMEINGLPAPKPIAHWPVPSGTTLLMRLDGGQNLPKLQGARDNFAAHMRCRDVELEPIYHNRGRCFVRIVRRDFLARSFPWPWLAYETTNFFGPIPAGMSVEGKPVYINLREKNVLVGGGMGSGKSWWLHTIIAAAMLDKRVNVWLLDGKEGSGFWAWRHSCSGFATNDKDDKDKAFAILASLEKRINEIYKGFKENDQRTIDWDKAKSIDLLVIDEFLAFFKIPGFASKAMDLLARGRAAGLIMIMTVQRPSSKIVDTDFRELFQDRAAGKSDKAGSKMILGEGVEADSSEFSGMNPGEMWLLEGSELTHMRGYSLTDRDLASLAARAQVLRANSPHETVKVAAQVKPDTPNGSRSPNPPSPVLVLLSPQPAPLSVQRRAVLQAIADLGPQVEGATVRAHIGMSPDRFSVHANALVTAGYVTRAAKPLQAPQFGHGRPAWCWTMAESGIKALNASRNERVAQDKEVTG